MPTAIQFCANYRKTIAAKFALSVAEITASTGNPDVSCS